PSAALACQYVSSVITVQRETWLCSLPVFLIMPSGQLSPRQSLSHVHFCRPTYSTKLTLPFSVGRRHRPFQDSSGREECPCYATGRLVMRALRNPILAFFFASLQVLWPSIGESRLLSA